MGLALAEGLQFGDEFGIVIREHGDGEESGVQSASIADGKGGDGDAAGHLDDGVEAVHTAEGTALHGDAEDGDGGHAGGHAWEMGGTAGTGDDAFEAAIRGGGGVIVQQLGRAVGADDFLFKGDAEVFEHLGGILEGGPVGTGAHDDAHEGLAGGGGAHRKTVRMAGMRAASNLRFGAD